MSANPQQTNQTNYQTLIHQTLTQNHPEKTYKLLLLNHPHPEKPYLKALSATLAGVCPLTFPIKDPTQRNLLFAYSMRKGLAETPEQKRPFFTTRLTRLQPPRPEDLPNLTLIPGSGCTFFSHRYDSQESRWEEELAYLKPYNDPHFLFRKFVLHKNLEHKKQADEAALALLALPVQAWQTMDLKELAYLFAHKKPNPEKLWPLVLASTSENIAPFVALLDVPSFPEKHHALWSHLATIPKLKNRAYVLAQLARSHFQKGHIDQTLFTLRTLLQFNAAQKYVALTESIIAHLVWEFAFDEALLGALQGALPRSIWVRSLQRSFLVQALSGDRKSTQKLHAWSRGAKVRLYPQAPQSFLLAVGARRWKASQVKLKRFVHRYPSFFQTVAQTMLAFPEAQKALPYFAAYFTWTEMRLKKGRIARPPLLYEMAEQAPDSAWRKARNAVGAEEVVVGSLSLKTKTEAFPFVWEPQGGAPPRKLVMMPAQDGSLFLDVGFM